MLYVACECRIVAGTMGGHEGYLCPHSSGNPLLCRSWPEGSMA